MPDVQLEQKTRTSISSAVAIALVGFLGAASAAGFLLLGNQTQTTPLLANTTNTNTTTTNVDLATLETPKPEFTSSDLAKADTALIGDATSGVSVKITSPTEGAITNGNQSVTVELTDPGHKAIGVRVLLYGDMMPGYMQGVATNVDTTAPYTFSYNLGLYPSGEHRYVAQAVKVDSSLPGPDALVVLASSDTMVTWARTCYYLAYQDMVLNAPTTSVSAGSSFTLTGNVTNHMRGNCQNIYDLKSTQVFFGSPSDGPSLLPTGWTATFSPASMNLGIGETGRYSMTIQVPARTAAGKYQVGATSVRQGTGFIVSKSVDVNVTNSIGTGL